MHRRARERKGGCRGRGLHWQRSFLMSKRPNSHSVQPPDPDWLMMQLADSRTRAIPVDLVAERVSMTELFPDKPMLMQNYPNPFNPETWIPYQLSADSEVIISIYDSTGEPVRRLRCGVSAGRDIQQIVVEGGLLGRQKRVR